MKTLSWNNGPKACAHLLNLLNAIAEANTALTASDLSKKLDCHRAALRDMLSALTTQGFLALRVSRYDFGPAMFRLAASIAAAGEVADNGPTLLSELAQRARETVLLGVMDPAKATVITMHAVNFMQHDISCSVRIGDSYPLHATAAGRLLLAFADEKWRTQYLSDAAPIHPSLMSIDEELQAIRRTGLSVSIAKMFPEASSIAAPLYGAHGQIEAAIAIVAPTERLKGRLAELSDLMSKVAPYGGWRRPPISARDVSRLGRQLSIAKRRVRKRAKPTAE